MESTNNISSGFSNIRTTCAEDAAAPTAVINEIYAQFAERAADLSPVSQGIAEDFAQHRVRVAEVEDAVVRGLVPAYGLCGVSA